MKPDFFRLHRQIPQKIFLLSVVIIFLHTLLGFYIEMVSFDKHLLDRRVKQKANYKRLFCAGRSTEKRRRKFSFTIFNRNKIDILPTHLSFKKLSQDSIKS
jgi:hypothetical protein